MRLHKPVLAQEVIEGLHIKNQASYIDATLGTGGHAEKIIQKGGRVLGIDADVYMVKLARERLTKACSVLNRSVKDYVTIVHGNFKDINNIAKKLGFTDVGGVLFDLGVSSLHFEDSSRGFSFRKKDAQLDMRLDSESQNIKASDLLNLLRSDQLVDLFSNVVSFSTAKEIADLVVQKRSEGKIETVGDFLNLLERVHGLSRGSSKVHLATKPFMALRIAVNSELDNLKQGLRGAFRLLDSQGRLVVISFHSGEDTLVKKYFRKLQKEGAARAVGKQPIVPTEKEIAKNPRARSAKLRIIEKV